MIPTPVGISIVGLGGIASHHVEGRVSDVSYRSADAERAVQVEADND